MEKLTQEVHAARLGLKKLNDAVDRLDSRKASRWEMGLLSLVVAGLLALTAVFWLQARANDLSECRDRNANRADVRSAIVETVELIVSGTEDPSHYRALIGRVEANLLDKIPVQEC